MKKIYLLSFIAAIVLFGSGSANAQKQQCVSGIGKGQFGTIKHSNDFEVLCQDEQSVTLISVADVRPQQKRNAASHTLNVYFPENSDCKVHISDGTDLLAQMENSQGDHLTIDLEEGTYHLFAAGHDFNTDRMCIWVLDDMELIEDTDIQIDFGQCEYGLTAHLVDENNTPFTDLNVINSFYCIEFRWLDGLVIQINTTTRYIGYEEQLLQPWYTSFNDNSSLELVAAIEPGNQKSYFFSFPETYGMSENLEYGNTADELSICMEMINLGKDVDTSYYHIDSKRIFKFSNGNSSATYFSNYDDRLIFDPSMPYSIFSNLRIGEPTAFESGSILLMPTVYEEFIPSRDITIRTPLYINTEGQVVREALPYFQGDFNMVSIPNWFPETPAMTVNPGSKTTYFGERTPLSCYYPIAFRGDNFPLGVTIFSGSFFYSGEHSCERACDYDQPIKVLINGEEVFNDSIYLFNRSSTFMPDAVPVVIEATNKHLIANGVEKINETRVGFDLENDDAIPPTMTFLRVLNENGEESIQITDTQQSSIVFGCADFTYLIYEEMGELGIKAAYNAKPEVDIHYSIDGQEWLPLEVIEDEGLFHENHGNVFVADLSQLDSQVANHWVSCKFTLTDEAGNSQEQELTNLFFAGDLESVNEQVSIKHLVFPNPFTNEVRITTADAVNGNADIQIYNVLGAQVYRQTVNCKDTKEFTIDGSTLKSGIYFYRISTKKGQMRGKIVKK